MDGLVSWLKELAVFIIICETILSFSPTGVYKRYIKPFVGLILLLRISAFLFGTIEVDWNNRIHEVFTGYEQSVSRYLENIPVVEREHDEKIELQYDTDNGTNEELKRDLINVENVIISPIEIGGNG